MVRRYRQSRLMQTDAINVILNYKYILYIEVTHTNYLINSLNTFTNKTLVPSFGILFTHLFINKKLYYNNSLSLNESINLTSISL